VRDRLPLRRAAGLGPEDRPGRHRRPPLEPRRLRLRFFLRLRPLCLQRPPPRRALASGRPGHRRNRPPTNPAIRLGSPNRTDDQ
jgi:hypothetical protein